MFEIKLCKSKGSYEVNPEKGIKLDLQKVKKNFNTLVDTPILLLIKKDDEILVHSHGKLIFKNLKDKKRIKEVANEIYKKGT